MNLQDFSHINLDRLEEWHPNGLEEWSVADWAVAMAGEAGEICNAVKKLRRIETSVSQVTGPPNTRESNCSNC